MNKKLLSFMMAMALTVSATTYGFAAKKTSKCDNKACLVHTTGKQDEITKAQSKFLNRVDEEEAFEHVEELASDIGPRISTTQEEYEGAEYIAEEFEDLGFATEIVPFDVVGKSPSTLKDGEVVIESKAFTGAQPTTTPLTAEIVDCGLARDGELDNIDVKGKIALISRGENTFVNKVANATKAGAIAVVMYNNVDSGVVSASQTSTDAPAVGITKADGLALVNRIKAGEVITLSVEVGQAPINKSWNVVASKKPSTKGNKVDKNDTDKVVLVTGHMDSVPLAPGANDNASGCAGMLEIARAMKGLDIDKEVRFIAFGSEEVGLLGSKAYVKTLSAEDKSKIEGVFNMDMVATGYGPCNELGIYTSNGQENIVTKAMAQAGEKLNCLTTDSVNYDAVYDGQMGSSDHVPFTDAGIPASLFINVDPAKKGTVESPTVRPALEPYYHQPSDNVDNFSPERLVRSVKLVGVALYDTLNVK